MCQKFYWRLWFLIFLGGVWPWFYSFFSSPTFESAPPPQNWDFAPDYLHFIINWLPRPNFPYYRKVHIKFILCYWTHGTFVFEGPLFESFWDFQCFFYFLEWKYFDFFAISVLNLCFLGNGPDFMGRGWPVLTFWALFVKISESVFGTKCKISKKSGSLKFVNLNWI